MTIPTSICYSFFIVPIFGCPNFTFTYFALYFTLSGTIPPNVLFF